MSGGVAYILDEAGQFAQLYNPEMIEIVPLEPEDGTILKGLIENHVMNTNSRKAAALLSDWSAAQKQFIRVQPIQPKPAPPVPEPELAAAGK